MKRAARPLLSAVILAGVLLAGQGRAATGSSDVLWQIVHDKCVPNMQENYEPKPCSFVSLDSGVTRGYAVLKDIAGDTQFLLVPTAKLSGIESPDLLVPGWPNYFAYAWQMRAYTERAVGHALDRDSIALAINSVYGRSQNQLHIHIDCVNPQVRDALRRNLGTIGDRWAPLVERLAGHRYRAIRVFGEGLQGNNPFVILADAGGAKDEMGQHTLVVIGAVISGQPAFVLLDNKTDPASGDRAGGEELQDHTCAVGKMK
jgi:CDP-diacylglycerol pyrophosphatase